MRRLEQKVPERDQFVRLGVGSSKLCEGLVQCGKVVASLGGGDSQAVRVNRLPIPAGGGAGLCGVPS